MRPVGCQLESALEAIEAASLEMFGRAAETIVRAEEGSSGETIARAPLRLSRWLLGLSGVSESIEISVSSVYSLSGLGELSESMPFRLRLRGALVLGLLVAPAVELSPSSLSFPLLLRGVLVFEFFTAPVDDPSPPSPPLLLLRGFLVLVFFAADVSPLSPFSPLLVRGVLGLELPAAATSSPSPLQPLRGVSVLELFDAPPRSPPLLLPLVVDIMTSFVWS